MFTIVSLVVACTFAWDIVISLPHLEHRIHLKLLIATIIS